MREVIGRNRRGCHSAPPPSMTNGWQRAQLIRVTTAVVAAAIPARAVSRMAMSLERMAVGAPELGAPAFRLPHVTPTTAEG